MKSLLKLIALAIIVIGASYVITTGAFWLYLNLTAPLKVDASTSVLTPQSTLTVHNSDSSALQPVQALYEDEVRPSDVIQPAMIDNELQHMKNSWFIQGTEYVGYWAVNPQTEELPALYFDTSDNTVKPSFVRLGRYILDTTEHTVNLTANVKPVTVYNSWDSIEGLEKQ